MPEFKIPEDFAFSMDLQRAAKLIDIIAKEKLSGIARDRFDWTSGFTVGYNQNSDVIYAYDQDGETLVEDGEYFYSTSWNGLEGTMEEHIENIINYDDYEKDDMEEILDVFGDYMSESDKEEIEDKIRRY